MMVNLIGRREAGGCLVGMVHTTVMLYNSAKEEVKLEEKSR